MIDVGASIGGLRSPYSVWSSLIATDVALRSMVWSSKIFMPEHSTRLMPDMGASAGFGADGTPCADQSRNAMRELAVRFGR
jgi:hypothetical protein